MLGHAVHTADARGAATRLIPGGTHADERSFRLIITNGFYSVAGTGKCSYAPGVQIMFHVSSALNRSSIQSYGLDASRMGAARGIAGSTRPEADGIFLVEDEWEVSYFVRMNNTGGPVDVWQVDGVDVDQMVDNGNGYFYLPGRIPVDQLTLLQHDLGDGDPFQA